MVVVDPPVFDLVPSVLEETVKLCWGVANAELLVHDSSSPRLLKPQFVTLKQAKKTFPPPASHVHELRLGHTGQAGGRRHV